MAVQSSLRQSILVWGLTLLNLEIIFLMSDPGFHFCSSFSFYPQWKCRIFFSFLFFGFFFLSFPFLFLPCFSSRVCIRKCSGLWCWLREWVRLE